MKKISISILISIIILFTIVNTSYGAENAFTPSYYKSDDGKLLIYNTINAARIRLANGQIVADAKVTGESEIEVQQVYEDTEVILIIDRSGSMSGEKMESAKLASKELISNLLNIQNVKIALIGFDSEADVLSNFSNNKEILNDKVDILNASGGTYLKKALNKIGSEIIFSNSVKLKNRIIVTVTDGETEDASDVAQKYKEYKENEYKLYHVLLGYENTSAVMYNGEPLGTIFEDVSTQALSNIFNEIYESVYSELITVQPPYLNVKSVNAQLLGRDLVFYLDNELVQSATLDVEYLINVKAGFDCTELKIINYLGTGFIFDKNEKLLTNPSQTNNDFLWQVIQNNSNEKTILGYIGNKIDGFVLKRGEELNIKLVVSSELLSTTGGEIGGVTVEGNDVFNTEIKMLAKGEAPNENALTYSSDTINLEGTNIIITPPWGKDKSNNITIGIVIILLILVTIILLIKRMKEK